jgi:hypothetical protein
MEAIIRTNDKNRFRSLIQFLKSLNFQIETKKENEISETLKRKLLGVIHKGGDGKSISDPRSWQQEIRKGRNLPFTE